jgi:DNA-binding transcriptional MerR regulator
MRSNGPVLRGPVPRPRGRGRSRSRGPGRRAARRAARPPSGCDPESAARLVAAIRLYSDAGFTLAEQKVLIAPRDGAPGWRELAQRKLAELDEQIARAQAAREAISHGLRCPHEDITQCPNFNAGVTARLAGQSLSRSHLELHGELSGSAVNPLPAATRIADDGGHGHDPTSRHVHRGRQAV